MSSGAKTVAVLWVVFVLLGALTWVYGIGVLAIACIAMVLLLISALVYALVEG